MCVRGCTSVRVRPCEQESGDRPQRCPGPGQGTWDMVAPHTMDTAEPLPSRLSDDQPGPGPRWPSRL